MPRLPLRHHVGTGFPFPFRAETLPAPQGLRQREEIGERRRAEYQRQRAASSSDSPDSLMLASR